MITQHSVLMFILVFDLLVGSLLLRYLWLARGAVRIGRVSVSCGAIAVLVNSSGLFCGARIVEAVVVFGGLPLAVLLLSAIDKQSKANEA